MKKFVAMAALIAAVLVAGPMLAAEKEGGAKVVVSGVNISLATEFGGEGAGDGEFTKINGLKVTSAKDAEGNELPDLKGAVLHYVPSAKSEKLAVGAENLAKTVTVTGTLWQKSSSLSVSSFEAEEEDDWGDVPIGTQSNKQIL